MNFFSKNRFFGRISKPVALKPFSIDKTTSSGQFPCLMTTVDFFNEKLQPTKNSLKQVKKLSKKLDKIEKREKVGVNHSKFFLKVSNSHRSDQEGF